MCAAPFKHIVVENTLYCGPSSSPSWSTHNLMLTSLLSTSPTPRLFLISQLALCFYTCPENKTPHSNRRTASACTNTQKCKERYCLSNPRSSLERRTPPGSWHQLLTFASTRDRKSTRRLACARKTQVRDALDFTLYNLFCIESERTGWLGR